MMHSIRRGLMSTFCVAACLATNAAAQDAPQDTVRLRFAWTPDTHAQIETTRLHTRTSGSADTVAGSARYRMHVQQHPAGLIISYDDFVFPEPADTSARAQANSLAEQAAAMVPRVVVDRSGTFVGIEGVDIVRARLDTVVTQMLPPDEAAAARETLDNLVTEEALAGLAAQEWNTIVGRWAGRDLVAGTSYTFEEQAALPMIPGAVVTLVSEFTVEPGTSCTGDEGKGDCVTLRLRARADPQEVRELLAKFTERLLATPGLGIAFESFEMGNELVLVTDAATLRPYRVQISKGMKGVYSADGERGEVSQTEVRTFRYTYGQ